LSFCSFSALAKAGISVVQIDENDYYGSSDATINWSQLADTHDVKVHEFSDVDMSDSTKRATLVDLSPNMLFASSPLVQLLIDSGIGRYVEFKAPDGFFSFMQSSDTAEFIRVPLSRSEVFSSSVLGPLEKRQLMKFFETMETLPDDVSEAFSIRDICDRLKLSRKLETFLRQFFFFDYSDVRYPGAWFKERLTLFVNSCGRYAENPLLYPFYGSAEIPQAFCRAAAVAGTIFILSSHVISIMGTKLKCQTAHGEVIEVNARVVLRRVNPLSNKDDRSLQHLVTLSKSNVVCEGADFALGCVEPADGGGDNPIYVLGCGPHMSLCDRNQSLLHFATVSENPLRIGDLPESLKRHVSTNAMVSFQSHMSPFVIHHSSDPSVIEYSGKSSGPLFGDLACGDSKRLFKIICGKLDKSEAQFFPPGSTPPDDEEQEDGYGDNNHVENTSPVATT
jgi:RAB protein geranylgeranyltransferase component A